MRYILIEALRTIVLIIWLSNTLSAKENTNTSELFPVFIQTTYGYNNAKYGYIDNEGKVSIKPQFEFAGEFFDGLAVAKLNRNDKYGYIDSKGLFFIKPQFDDAEKFSEGLAAVCVNKKWGYIDKNGEIVIAPKFDVVSMRSSDDIFWIDIFQKEVGPFSQGLAAVLVDKKWGYINRSGDFLIQPRFDKADTFAQDLAAVQVGGKWGYINKTGNFVIQPIFSEAGRFSESLAPVSVDKKWGFMDKMATFVIKPKFDRAKNFSEGLAAVQIDNKWGYLDKTGSIIIKPQFDDAENFYEGFAKVGIETESLLAESAGGVPWSLVELKHKIYGYVKKTGEIVIKPQFRDGGSFKKGLAWVNTDEVTLERSGLFHKKGYINNIGTYIWNPSTKIEVELSEKEKLFAQLHSTNIQEHFEAALALVKIGKTAVPELIKLIDNDAWHVSVTSIWILGEIGDTSAVGPLAVALKSTEKIGPPGYTSYIGDMSFKPQKDLALYESPNSFPSWNLLFKRRAAAVALGNLGGNQAVDALNKALKEGPFYDGAEAKVAIAKAIKKITGQPLPEEIEEELKKFSNYK